MRGTNTTGRVAAAAAVVALLLLSACTDEPDDTPTAPTFAAPSTTVPKPSPSESAEPSTAESTTPALAAPALPAAATEETPEGAAAFAEWWFETLNYATATGDTDGFRTTYTDTCTSCEGFAQQVDEPFASGGSIDGGALLAQVTKPDGVQDGVATMPILVEAQETVILSADGEAIETLDSERLNLVMAVVWSDQGWAVGDLVR